MYLSVVVCTRDRPAQLRASLVCFARLSGAPAWELVVVNSGAGDATADLLREHRRTAPHPLTVVTEQRPRRNTEPGAHRIEVGL